MPNQDTLKDLTAAQVMVNSRASFMADGLADAGVTKSDLNRGFVAESLNEEGRTDDAGTNFVGSTYDRPGFAGPISKYKRL